MIGGWKFLASDDSAYDHAYEGHHPDVSLEEMMHDYGIEILEEVEMIGYHAMRAADGYPMSMDFRVSCEGGREFFEMNKFTQVSREFMSDMGLIVNARKGGWKEGEGDDWYVRNSMTGRFALDALMFSEGGGCHVFVKS
ncbi:hypothetical protein GCM10009757_02440 [Streptomyces cheonanensis]|uniref:Uncharacterized protein n=1 Tax=Streptomyces cheonanensis TaxID=312720 RepID=A0ABN2UP25_9ACTN